MEFSKFHVYKEFVKQETLVNEFTRDGLTKVIKKLYKKIDSLVDTLAIPREHYAHIEKLSADELIKQANLMLTNMSEKSLVPKEALIKHVYENTSKEKAKMIIREGMSSSQLSSADRERENYP